jgi:hypothetical protein
MGTISPKANAITTGDVTTYPVAISRMINIKIHTDQEAATAY